tara:strand:- start:49 stop:429 length:381 start_codon:yes stop_codon:yes gene_type:complete
MLTSEIKKFLIFLTSIFFSLDAQNQSYDDEIVVGMTLNSVCKNYSLKISDRYKDPCHGFVQHVEEKELIMLWNRDETLFLVFNNVPSSAFNRRDRLNFKKVEDDSKLLLITTSGEEGLFYMRNMVE